MSANYVFMGVYVCGKKEKKCNDDDAVNVEPTYVRELV